MQTSVAVIGGGSTGSSILYHLAKSGLTDSLLIEQGSTIASGQTSRSTALVRTHYTIPTVAKMALRSYQVFRHFQEYLPGYTAGYVETGLLIGVDSQQEPAVRQNVDSLRRLGIDSRLIESREEVRRLEPLLDSSGFSLVVHEPNTGYAEPSTTASSYASAARDMGARVLSSARLTNLRRQGDGLYELSTSAGTVTASKVVLATGVWSRQVFAPLGVELPIKTVRHPVAIFGRPSEFSGIRPVVFDFPRSAYYKPEGQNLLHVGSMEAELDASSPAVDPDRYDEGISFDETEKFTDWTARAYPIMGEKGVFERGYSGVYDNTPDQQPIIDELADHGYEDVFCLVGLSGHGFKLCPEFGRVMASMVRRERLEDYDLSLFRLRRFKDGALLKSRYSLSTVG